MIDGGPPDWLLIVCACSALIVIGLLVAMVRLVLELGVGMGPGMPVMYPPPPPPPTAPAGPDVVVIPSMGLSGSVRYRTQEGQLPDGTPYRAHIRDGHCWLSNGRGRIRTPAWRTPNEDGEQRPA